MYDTHVVCTRRPPCSIRSRTGPLGTEPTLNRPTSSTGTSMTPPSRDWRPMVVATAGQGTMIGQLEPAGATTSGLQSRDGGVSEAPVDDVGRFSVGSVPSGPVRLRMESGG